MAILEWMGRTIEETDRALRAVAAVPSGAPDLSRSRIVIVDDQPFNVELLELILQREGYKDVVGTTEPADLFVRYLTPCPDLILLDLHMGAIDGFAVLERLRREIPEDQYVPVLTLTADMSSQARTRALALGSKDFVTKPFDPAEVVLRVRNLLETRFLHRRLQSQKDDLETKVSKQTSELRRAFRTLKQAQEQLRDSQEETIYRLGIAAELRDNETARHIERMSRYCGVLAEELGLGAERSDLIRMASVMHDVGKIGIPDEILLKPGPLTAQERTVMQRHAQIGYQILAGSASPTLQLASVVALNHHERIDGTGYPMGLSGEAIPLEARIAAIADVFDALTTDRVYRPAFELPQALDTMKEGRGTQFDPDLLDLFFTKQDRILTVQDNYADSQARSAASC